MVRHEVLSDEPTAAVSNCYASTRAAHRDDSLNTGVVPPEPKPVESYIVARNCKPAGCSRSKEYEYGWERPRGMEMFCMWPAETSTVYASAPS